MEVSINGGTPKSSILMGISPYKPPIRGSPYFRKPPNMFVAISSSWGGGEVLLDQDLAASQGRARNHQGVREPEIQRACGMAFQPLS